MKYKGLFKIKRYWSKTKTNIFRLCPTLTTLPYTAFVYDVLFATYNANKIFNYYPFSGFIKFIKITFHLSSPPFKKSNYQNNKNSPHIILFLNFVNRYGRAASTFFNNLQTLR